mmetsp:Transcript_35345/g.110152  ORF Transcript_35345/g.110152 Transcript_35345/m.110152 type:complete len:396 (-) Transcript_35345:54-1241(-)
MLLRAHGLDLLPTLGAPGLRAAEDAEARGPASGAGLARGRAAPPLHWTRRGPVAVGLGRPWLGRRRHIAGHEAPRRARVLVLLVAPRAKPLLRWAPSAIRIALGRWCAALGRLVGLGVACILPKLGHSRSDRVAEAQHRDLPLLDAQRDAALLRQGLQGRRIQVAAGAHGDRLFGATLCKPLEEPVRQRHGLVGTEEPHFLTRALNVDAATTLRLQTRHRSLRVLGHGARPHELCPDGRAHGPPWTAEAGELPLHCLHGGLRARHPHHPPAAVQPHHRLAAGLDRAQALPPAAAEGGAQLRVHGEIHRDDALAMDAVGGVEEVSARRPLMSGDRERGHYGGHRPLSRASNGTHHRGHLTLSRVREGRHHGGHLPLSMASKGRHHRGHCTLSRGRE